MEIMKFHVVFRVRQFSVFSELREGKAIVTYTKLHPWKKVQLQVVARRSIDCKLLGCMMICEIEFVKWAVKLGKSVTELSLWWP